MGKNGYYLTEEQRKEFELYVTKYFGPIYAVIHEDEYRDTALDIFVIAPGKDHDYYTLITCGIGAFPMEVEDEENGLHPEFAEYAINLPSYFSFSPDNTEQWPIILLKTVARFPITYAKKLVSPDRIVFFEGKGKSFDPTTTFTSVLILDTMTTWMNRAECQHADGKKVSVYTVYPLYDEEQIYLDDHDFNDLLHLLIEKIEDYPVANPTRLNAITFEVRKTEEDILRDGISEGKKKLDDGDIRGAMDLYTKMVDSDAYQGKGIITADFLYFSASISEKLHMYEEASEGYTMAANEYGKLIEKEGYSRELGVQFFKTVIKAANAAEDCDDFQKMCELNDLAKQVTPPDGHDTNEGLFARSLFLFLQGQIYAYAEKYEEAIKLQSDAAAYMIELSKIGGTDKPEYTREFIRQIFKTIVLLITIGSEYNDILGVFEEAEKQIESLKKLNSVYEDISRAELALLRGIASGQKSLKAHAHVMYADLAKKHPEFPFLEERVEASRDIM